MRDIVPLLQDAFQIGRSGTPTPVFVELSAEVLQPASVVLSDENEAVSVLKSTGGVWGLVSRWCVVWVLFVRSAFQLCRILAQYVL